jgi:benzoylformate decarboxylase
VIGAGVDRAGAREITLQLAEKLSCDVFGDPLGSRVGFPTDHPLFRGMLLPAAPRITQALDGHDVIVVIGAPLFLVYPYLPGPLTPPGARAYLITDDPAEAARAPATAAFIGDVADALRELIRLVPQKDRKVQAQAVEAARRRMEAARARAQMGIAYVLQALGQRLPAEAVVLDEAISASPALREHVPVGSSAAYFTAASGGLGWALPAAVGVKLAWPDRPVVAVIGDGSLLYAVQALWTAAREKLALAIIVLDNAGYAILKSYANAFYPGQADLPGLDLPGMDFIKIAEGLGAKAERVARADELDAALDRALGADGPYLLDVQIDRRVPNLF